MVAVAQYAHDRLPSPFTRDLCKTTSFLRKPAVQGTERPSRGVGQTGIRLPMCRPKALAGSFAKASSQGGNPSPQGKGGYDMVV